MKDNTIQLKITSEYMEGEIVKHNNTLPSFNIENREMEGREENGQNPPVDQLYVYSMYDNLCFIFIITQFGLYNSRQL